jgi:hypothetical protein
MKGGLPFIHHSAFLVQRFPCASLTFGLLLQEPSVIVNLMSLEFSESFWSSPL